MAAVDVQQPIETEPAPTVPDYLASPNAVFDDEGVEWRYGHPPDYSKTRADWEKTKTMNHTAGSLPQLVENLVKNWEVEASFKPRLQDWRTIDHANYSFAINGGPPQTAEHMLKVGTYNAIVTANEFYSPEHSDFATSHKTFKRMMPTFAWEVLEVYSGPPKVAFRWRHWGEMKNDYVGFNDKGEKVTVKAHGGTIDIEGVTVASVDDKVRLQSVETWFDPMAMFRQIAPRGIVNREIVDKKVVKPEVTHQLVNDGVKIAEEHNSDSAAHSNDSAPDTIIAKESSPSTGLPADQYVPNQGTTTTHDRVLNDTALKPHQAQQAPVTEQAQQTAHAPTAHQAQQGQQAPTTQQAQQASLSINAESSQLVVDAGTSNASPIDSGAASESSDKTWEKVERPTEITTRMDMPEDLVKAIESGKPEDIATALQGDQPQDMEKAVQPHAGEAVVAPADSEEACLTYEEMSNIASRECPFLMNRE